MASDVEMPIVLTPSTSTQEGRRCWRRGSMISTFTGFPFLKMYATADVYTDSRSGCKHSVRPGCGIYSSTKRVEPFYTQKSSLRHVFWFLCWRFFINSLTVLLSSHEKGTDSWTGYWDWCQLTSDKKVCADFCAPTCSRYSYTYNANLE